MIEENFQHIELNLTPEQNIEFQNLLHYIKETWLNTIGIGKMSCYEMNLQNQSSIESIQRLGEFQRVYETTVNGSLNINSSAYDLLGEENLFI